MDQDRYRKFGKLFGVYEGAEPVLFVADPELVKRVLVKDFPSLPNRRAISFNDPLLDNMMSIILVEKWRRIRPAASPAFSTGKLRKPRYDDSFETTLQARSRGVESVRYTPTS
ncbi:hypothetical protein HPB47_016572 [Ixodes persulcatus]|uniref:Uncharacterized protein n=1 Tax=Ixodes persulcatus TaxID=34615 RepID=A0AC60QQK0_IXOPE|nr:hypothetical protein HPB47_016572 [Ixodes persulcatus]